MGQTRLARICSTIALLALLAGCEAGMSPTVSTGSAGSSAPVCVGTLDCLTKMNAARSWIAANSGLGLVVDSQDVLETGGWGMPAYTSVRVERSSLGGDRYWIVARIQCGNNSSTPRLCPDTAAALANFNTAVSAAF